MLGVTLFGIFLTPVFYSLLRAGTEWGLYQAFKGGWSACSSASQTLDLVAVGCQIVRITAPP